MQHHLGDYYVSIAGPDAHPVDAGTGPAFAQFCEAYRKPIASIQRTRLVQTNQVQRALVMRLGLAMVRRVTTAPVRVVEVGCSAGINLRADRYAYSVGTAIFGNPRLAGTHRCPRHVGARTSPYWPDAGVGSYGAR